MSRVCRGLELDAFADPLVEFECLFGCLAGGLVLLGDLAVDEAVVVGGAHGEVDGKDGGVVGGDGGVGLGTEGAARWDGVEDDGEWSLGEAGDLDGGADGLEIEEVGAAGDEDEVGGAGGGEGGALGVGGGVDDGEVGALLAGLFEDDGEAVGLRGLDDGGFLLAEVLPGGGAGLGVEIDEDAGLAGTFGGDGEVQGEGGFAHATLLGDDRDCLHIFL